MSFVKGFVESRLEELDLQKIPKPIKFSISIENETNFRLQYLAKILETNRSSLAAEFIQCAISDAEKTLGINPFDFESEYGKAYLEKCGGSFYHDETGYYRVLANGEKIKLVSPDQDNEIDYSLQIEE